jgi:hypothetical protein
VVVVVGGASGSETNKTIFILVLQEKELKRVETYKPIFTLVMQRKELQEKKELEPTP